MANVINTGISALNAFKRQMETTGHNIANVNTEGYSRQRVDLDTRRPESTLQGYIGSGVDVSSIRRTYDDYLALRVRDYTSLSEESSVYEARARQVDDVIADEAAGINGVMQQFFASVNDVADDPTSIEARAVMLNRANQMADRFTALDQWFTDIRRRLNQDLEREVNEVNALAQSLVEVNRRIGSMNGLNGGIPADVLDERDRLIDRMSQYTNVSAVPQENGMVSVSVGTGQVLVLGVNRNVMAVEPNPQAADRMELTIQSSGSSPVRITEQMSGGRLGGLLRFRDEILDESHNALGRVAIGITHFFNEQHRTGMDLDGDLGGDFFVPVSGPQVLGDGNVTAAFADVGDLTPNEYQLEFTATGWALTDLTTGANVPITVTTAGTSATIAVDTSAGAPIGFELNVLDTGVVSAGDTYRVRPARLGANQFAVRVANERDVAAAEYLSTGTGPVTGPLNTGTGVISAGGLDSLDSSVSTPLTGMPITVTYSSVGTDLTLSGGPAGTTFVDSSGAAIASPAFVSGETYRVRVAGLGTYRFTLSGSPDDGDRFRIVDNSGGSGGPVGVGDNRNARALADLQKANLMIGGTATLANAYGTLVADIGTRTQQARSNAEIQANLLSQAESAKSEVSGVNLDEEAANLVRFQQAYQAAAQVISVANSLFDSLINAVRR